MDEHYPVHAKGLCAEIEAAFGNFRKIRLTGGVGLGEFSEEDIDKGGKILMA